MESASVLQGLKATPKGKLSYSRKWDSSSDAEERLVRPKCTVQHAKLHALDGYNVDITDTCLCYDLAWFPCRSCSRNGHLLPPSPPRTLPISPRGLGDCHYSTPPPPVMMRMTLPHTRPLLHLLLPPLGTSPAGTIAHCPTLLCTTRARLPPPPP